ncbi:hypothetical protein HOLleu_40436 [Holothuria leucospilota]|uniref:Sulfotransferase family protein n=1 Tax=Holothuria leucospilota TaxID=206669 RepID=A0A9Q0YHQ2_HOLLE|nr:hypothetical protein HOLleu_40436 [Holothuria leucospilota]
MADSSQKQQRIFLWCWPRSISTAVEKCLSFVDGMQTWHEPYTVAFNAELLTNKAIMQEGNSDSPIAKVLQEYNDMMKTLANQPTEFSGGKFMPVANFTYPFVKEELEKEEPGKKYILIKDMATAVLDRLDALPDVPTRHTFIIRHPYRFLLSQRKMFFRISNYQGDPNEFDMFKALPVMSDTIFQRDGMHLVWKHVQESGKDPNPIIIDAEDVMNYPETILPKYLAELGIPFDKKYLTWDESIDSIRKTWKGALEQVALGYRMGVFDKAFNSSCFNPSAHVMPKREELTPDILRIVDFVLPGYEEMYEKRIKPE